MRRASDGERLIVTRHGRPVAQIGPPDLPTREERRAAIRRIKESSKGNRLGGHLWKYLRDEAGPDPSFVPDASVTAV